MYPIGDNGPEDESRFSPDEQRLLRKWRLGVLAFYGLILAALWVLPMIGSRFMQIAGSVN
jgi:hypothetical protein